MCNFTCLFFEMCLPSVSFLSPNCLLPFDKMVAVKKGRLIRKHDEREVLTFMMKRLFTLLLALLCMLSLLAGCGGKSTEQAPEEKPSGEQSVEEQTPEEGDDWYELDKETGALTVRIPAEKSGYTWNFIIDDESVLELLTCEATEGTFVASFRALNDGESQIIFSYVRNDALDEARILEVRCAGGKVTEVTPDDLEEINGTWEDDPEIADLRETNALLNVLKEHSAVTCVSESWDGENNWQYKTVTQFILNGGRLWYDYEQYDEGDQVTYCEAGYINDDVPGALYMVETEGGKYMDICPSDEYETFIADQWLRRTAGDYELYVESETDEEYGNATVIARRVNDVTGVCADVLYFTDSTTGLINGMEVTEYSSEDPAQAVSVTRSNIMYDEPRLMEERAAMAVLFPEDPCYLTVVVNPGQENEEEQSYQVDKSTLVEFEALEDFQLFYDVDCTEKMDWIDVGQNKLTVYVVPDISK